MSLYFFLQRRHSVTRKCISKLHDGAEDDDQNLQLSFFVVKQLFLLLLIVNWLVVDILHVELLLIIKIWHFRTLLFVTVLSIKSLFYLKL